jgi:hypothetical protein
MPPPLTFRFKALPTSLPSHVCYYTGRLSIRVAGLDQSLRRVRVPLVLLKAQVYAYEYCPSTLLMYLPTEALLRLRLWRSRLGIASFGAFVAVSTKRSRRRGRGSRRRRLCQCPLPHRRQLGVKGLYQTMMLRQSLWILDTMSTCMILRAVYLEPYIPVTVLMPLPATSEEAVLAV